MEKGCLRKCTVMPWLSKDYARKEGLAKREGKIREERREKGDMALGGVRVNRVRMRDVWLQNRLEQVKLRVGELGGAKGRNESFGLGGGAEK